ncbi:glycerate kinase type-2 family protein [Rhizobium sp. C1]|uniref:glycerate kinase type-2 family protein n=1 Tax=Rhizobium sp. C1 TaxID=1349799 RepID=UPI001E467F91|nr:glycerate kinase [Rhizobium sp. C1]MCD2178592.1 glycerate kinase [Rhizobium sp. C1]
MDPKTLLSGMFEAAIDAARPALVLPPVLPPRPASGRVVVIAAGKAAAAMAAAVETAWGGCEGLALTRYGHAVPTQTIEVVEAAHPVPDAAGQGAAQRILALAESLGAGDTLVFLISGGASALLSAPLAAITLAEKAALTRALLASGATIGEMNSVRRHLSAAKGGRLAAAAYPARCLTYAISDVPGDRPEVIGSGPTVADPTTQADALAVLKKYRIEAPPSIAAVLSDPAFETPKPGDPRFAGNCYELIATPQSMLSAAKAVAPLPCHLLGDAIEGEAREVGRVFAGLARAVREGKSAFTAPCILLSGGETTVTLPQRAVEQAMEPATGKGGRNVEFLMGFASEIAGLKGVSALAGDTDGIDGAAPVAGAYVDGTTADRARASGYTLSAAMAAYDGHGLFERLGDQIVTGPTHTNVNDFRAILIEA